VIERSSIESFARLSALCSLRSLYRCAYSLRSYLLVHYVHYVLAPLHISLRSICRFTLLPCSLAHYLATLHVRSLYCRCAPHSVSLRSTAHNRCALNCSFASSLLFAALCTQCARNIAALIISRTDLAPLDISHARCTRCTRYLAPCPCPLFAALIWSKD
jgi:hypothetical protein